MHDAEFHVDTLQLRPATCTAHVCECQEKSEGESKAGYGIIPRAPVSCTFRKRHRLHGVS